MKLVTANIKSLPKMLQSHVVHDIVKVRELGGVIMWQEIAPQRYKDAITQNVLHGWSTKHLVREIPISYRIEYWKLDRGNTGEMRTHAGRAHVTPARYITWCGLKHYSKRFPTVVFMNTHMISGAYSNHYPLTKKWRRAQWLIHFNKQQALIKEFNQAGITVVGGGDYNRVDLPKFTATQFWISRGGIDHMYVCPALGGTKIQLMEVDRYSDVYTDHDPRIARLFFSAPG